MKPERQTIREKVIRDKAISKKVTRDKYSPKSNLLLITSLLIHLSTYALCLSPYPLSPGTTIPAKAGQIISKCL